MKPFALRTVLVLILVASAAAGAAAQSSAAYRLDAGDVLQVSVWGHEDLSQLVQVRPDGKLSFPLVGELEVAGRTPLEVQEALTRSLAEYVKNPVVTVAVKEFRTISVQVAGEVRNPGVYPLRPGARVAEALAAAGGLGPAADPTRVHLISFSPSPSQKSSPSTVTLDLEGLFRRGEQESNRLLADGDQLVVPQLPKVTVFGEVRTPGLVAVQPRDGLLEILAKAGGPTPEADLAHVEVAVFPDGSLTAPVTTAIDLASPAADEERLTLSENGRTVITVPKLVRQVTVLGEVKNAGTYPVEGPTRLLDALGKAGGPTERAALERVRIYRGGQLDQPEAVVAGRDHLLFEGDSKADPLLEPGDVVFVPETKRPDWQKAITFLSGLNLLKDLLK